jgi:GH25 family lysozyme M1 (1,4-beta-N-acetylmuramidase)
MSVAQLATAVGPAAAAPAGSRSTRLSLSYLRAHAKYDHAGWELHHRRATSPPAVSAIPRLSNVLGPRAALPLASAASSRVLGLDVSAAQGNVNWSTVAAHGAKFAYVKATEGSYYINPFFAQQYNGSYSAKLIRGAYEFANPSYSSGTTQANYFVSHGGGWSADGHTLPGALDIEYNPYGKACYGLSTGQMVNWIKNFTSEYAAKEHAFPVIYSTTDWWRTCTANSAAFANDDPFWVASYGKTGGALPNGWGYYSFWQYSDSGTQPGDQDLFNGPYAGLRTLAVNG